MHQICPLEYRYGSDKLRRIFSRRNYIDKMILVEKTILKHLAREGIIPSKCSEIDIDIEVNPAEIDSMEKEIGHDTASLAILLSKKLGSCGKYVHLGVTSNDVIDTAWALVLREAINYLVEELEKLIILLAEKAREYRDLLMIGRTHGQHALPITFGFKLANYVYELIRSLDRLTSCRDRVVKCKVSGAVGTLAAWNDKGIVLQRNICRELGLEPYLITTQIAPRDGFAELASVLAILGSQLDRFALEVRELVRPEIDELIVNTPAISSSTMPHKKNPVKAERVSGLARILRGLTISGLENIVLMHERDLSNSSCERILIPHMFLVVDQMLRDTLDIVEKLVPVKENMLKNIELLDRTVLSECIVVKLVTIADMDRVEAYRLVSSLVERSLREKRGFREILFESRVSELLSRDVLEKCLDPWSYLGSYSVLIDRVLEEVYSRTGVKI